MRAAWRAQIGNRGNSPAFAPVILLANVLVIRWQILTVVTCAGARNAQQVRHHRELEPRSLCPTVAHKTPNPDLPPRSSVRGPGGLLLRQNRRNGNRTRRRPTLKHSGTPPREGHLRSWRDREP